MEQTAKLYCGLRASTHLRVGTEYTDEEMNKFLDYDGQRCCDMDDQPCNSYFTDFVKRLRCGIPIDQSPIGDQVGCVNDLANLKLDIKDAYCKYR
jgi:hypothetical protein